ncbi:hypothetical protein HYW19_03125 [Candidatus Woesearchaeota archaeon]|nr:hypothetical protein [Candidatus Woesearchaeota archaeon]
MQYGLLGSGVKYTTDLYHRLYQDAQNIAQKVVNSLMPRSGLELTVDDGLNAYSNNLPTQGNPIKMITRRELFFALAGYWLVFNSACSSQATPPPTPVIKSGPAPTPTLESKVKPKPTIAPTPTASSWYNDANWIYLTSFSRKPNPNREGWDRVDASFFLYQLPNQVGPDYWKPRKIEGGGLLHYEGFEGNFGIRLSWDGGSKDDMRISPSQLERGLDLTYFRAIPLAINTDVPSIATNLRLVPVRLNGQATTPNVWEPESLRQEYRKLVSRHLLRVIDISNKDVKYSVISKRLEKGNLVLELEVQNLSKQRDVDLQWERGGGLFAWTGGSGWPMFLAADGRYVGDGRALADNKYGTNPNFDWGDRKMVPPGFKAQGKLILPLYGTEKTAEYVFLNLRLPGISDLGWRLLIIPDN